VRPPRGLASRAVARDAAAAVRRRLRHPAFWHVQVMVLLITGGHFGIEATTLREELEHLHRIPVMLYVFPIMYAGLRFRWEGSLLTGAWCALLTLPNILLWHQHSLEWVVELLQNGVAVAVGVVVAMLVEHEAAARRRAEELAQRMGRVNRLILRAQEEERLRVSRDLHDGPAQTLIYLCHQLDAVARQRAGEARIEPGLVEARRAAESALGEVRTYSRDLRPSILDDVGLAAALEWLAKEATARGGVQVAWQVSGEPRRLAPELELALFRVAQEALRNVERHSGATKATVELSFGSHPHWRLRICDAGRGFDPALSMNDLVTRGNLGLNGMHERAELAGGRLMLMTAPGRGTTVEVTPAGGSAARRGRTIHALAPAARDCDAQAAESAGVLQRALNETR
jgi:signal transduction histidine kinase